MSSYCSKIKTIADRHWPYDEYYIGEKDGEDRKGGEGEQHWTGAKSIEWYTGSFLRDTLHGLGDYRWRYTGPGGVHTTYEGYFYSNDMHGYGTMSYADGMVFTGLYSHNVRYGPGVDTDFIYEDVGLWRGLQLVRLAWRPMCCSVIPDLSFGTLAKKWVTPHRVLLQTDSVVIGEVNSALDLLKQNGSDPQRAVDNWIKLYPKHCTDQASQLCHVKDFQRDYYKGRIQELKVIDALPPPIEYTSPDQILFDNNTTLPAYYYAWNNDDLIIDIMKHCYKHESQRKCQEMSSVNLFSIMSGQRRAFKRPGKHEVDCRTLLMASYLGDAHNVTILINDEDVNPGVTDNKGNSAVMYAACGDHNDIIHFLVEAGANVDSFNDSCCTALGLAILRFLFSQKDVVPSQMIQALTPPNSPPSPRQPIQAQDQVEEWNMSREAVIPTAGSVSIGSNKLMKVGKKSIQSFKDAQSTIKSKLPDTHEVVSSESLTEIKILYNIINLEYISKINDLFVLPSAKPIIPYIFGIVDMSVGIDIYEDPKKVPDKNTKKVVSKIIKDTTSKLSKEAVWRGSQQGIATIDSAEKLKMDMLSRIMVTIVQLLSDGANPKLVRCPQPALVMAVLAGCPDLVRQLVLHGANVNEKYPDMLDYTPLDLAISQPMSRKNLDLVRTLLECGSDANHRLKFVEQDQEVPGPTLLHVLLARNVENEAEIELQQELLDLLLQYKCDPMAQFKGRSAVDLALSKETCILNVFVENPTTNLNAVINHSHHTILVKMFSWNFFKSANSSERLQIITNLLLYGADPLIECQNDLEVYNNIFVFMKKTIFDIENPHGKINPSGSSKSIANIKPKPSKEKEKEKEKEKSKEKPKLGRKSSMRTALSEVADYKQAQELMMNCARMLIVRWLQAKLMKELVSIIDRYQHRQWNMILKEHKAKKPVGLWLSAQRCLEIWDILKTTRYKMYKNNRNLKHLLCIVMFYNKKYRDGEFKETTPTAPIKNAIDSDVAALLRDHKSGTVLKELKRPYVKPELTSKSEKFDVCFECILPNEDVTIRCQSCKQVVFCSLDCMKVNVKRPLCHPCSEYLKDRYFPSGSSDEEDDEEPVSKYGIRGRSASW